MGNRLSGIESNPAEATTRDWSGLVVFSIGHSTMPLETFLDRLSGLGIQGLADVRSFPHSRHNPWFNQESLSPALAGRGIVYVHLRDLGGRRHVHSGHSPNTAWRNASFRSYADYMQTDSFEEGLSGLHRLAVAGPVAILCAEAVPWRCHRSLISDVLVARGARVVEVLGERTRCHAITRFASVADGNVTYPGPA